MPVVSYAIPALVAIGQARYFHAPPWNPFTRFIRSLSVTRSLKVLRRMQPDSGGYLEATPLTAFVVMSLASIHRSPLAPREEMGPLSTRDVAPEGDPNRNSRSELPTVIREGVKFLVNSIRPDGSWPIDTNLATWNTTLAINALAGAGEDVAELLGIDAVVEEAFVRGDEQDAWEPVFARQNVLAWLLSCQHLQRHPFTGADRGGFGWSDLSGAVPDADDTPGAMLAIHAFDASVEKEALTSWMGDGAGELKDAGHWLRCLQNADGGWPTFCRGWGKLPFDRSGTDLTAHALRALDVWHRAKWFTDRWDFYQELRPNYKRRRERALSFLRERQHPDSSWSPLWFGNQDHPQEDNPVYGTAKVLMAYRDLGLMDSPEAQRGVAWLVANQNQDGGWGSGVWGRLRIADCGLRIGGQTRSAELGARSGVKDEDSVTGSSDGSHSVPSSQYSTPDTGQPDAMPAQSQIPNPKSQIATASNPQSAIPNPQLTSSIEETALAVEALLAAIPSPQSLAHSPPSAAVEKGLSWLIERVEQNLHRQPAPIGFYFAKLWYYERLYPLTFTVAALGRACRQFAHLAQPDSHAEPAPARAP
jgi:squalene-hopene/tetraprenyl-beta-curcumene cyclase